MNHDYDDQIRSLLGDRFVQFQKLILMMHEQPATRRYVEGEIARLLDTMLDADRVALRRALAGSRRKR